MSQPICSSERNKILKFFLEFGNFCSFCISHLEDTFKILENIPPPFYITVYMFVYVLFIISNLQIFACHNGEYYIGACNLHFWNSQFYFNPLTAQERDISWPFYGPGYLGGHLGAARPMLLCVILSPLINSSD